ncbi:hypothetical protein RQP46_005688 [Phenoliferia psychrophenolica]
MVPHLPPEIIGHIISLSLPPPHVAKSLQPRYDLIAVLCLVNRTWRALAQPHFFKHVEYDDKNDRLARLEAATEGNEELAALASRAQVVQLGSENDIGFYNRGQLAEALDRINVLHPSLATLWVQWAPTLSVPVLAQLKSLNFLHVGERSAAWLLTPPNVPTPLPKLSRLSVLINSRVPDRHLEDLLCTPISQFPALNHLSLLGRHCIEDPTFPRSPTPLSSAITSLVLMINTRDFPDGAREILPLFPNIRYLHLGYGTSKIPFLDRVASLSATDPQLESLVLEWNTASDEDLVISLDTVQLSNVKYLKLNYYVGDYGFSQGSDELREKCREKGVELEEKWWSASEKAQKESYYWG